MLPLCLALIPVRWGTAPSHWCKLEAASPHAVQSGCSQMGKAWPLSATMVSFSVETRTVTQDLPDFGNNRICAH